MKKEQPKEKEEANGGKQDKQPLMLSPGDNLKLTTNLTYAFLSVGGNRCTRDNSHIYGKNI